MSIWLKISPLLLLATWNHSLFLGIKDLLLEGVWLGETDFNFLGGELVVDLSHSINFVFNLLFIKGIEVNSDVFLSIECHSSCLSSDSGWVHLLCIIIRVFCVYIITISSSTASWTVVRVLLLGLCCFDSLLPIYNLINN